MNELPFRNVMKTFNVDTSGPNLHTGDIGLLLLKAENTEIVTFRLVNIPDEFKSQLESSIDLSSDQRYLRDILLIITSGIIPTNFNKRSPGKIGYARWLTTTNRILRIYISKEYPSSDLVSLTQYIIFCIFENVV